MLRSRALVERFLFLASSTTMLLGIWRDGTEGSLLTLPPQVYTQRTKKFSIQLPWQTSKDLFFMFFAYHLISLFLQVLLLRKTTFLFLALTVVFPLKASHRLNYLRILFLRLTAPTGRRITLHLKLRPCRR